MERFRFDTKLSLEDLLADLIDDYADKPETYVAIERFSIEDKEGNTWNVICYDDEAKEIKPGFRERFLAGLNTPIPHCGV